ncbi:hypothetical protein HCN44_009062 [Aphidius gifuensis]|uniref:G-protein coupled receptors family 1 profile domain-containing protein n=1 Tax=Aphidius gifuensis TaxID=684658 RepID=A0A834Y2V4_APHGI|nr:G-protein coupled receptor 161-like [Aphidius gifuensis]KAF7996024.1 hypothetical protein HCN44_009062 [Aphidius gifuensis]
MGPWAFGLPLFLISALGLLVNSYVLLVVLGLRKQPQQQQTANTLLLVHLSAVESAVCIVSIVFSISGWPITDTWCMFHGLLLTLLHPVALWTVTGLNCDRYYAIASPLHYTAKVSPKRITIGLIGSWTIGLLLCLPPLSGFAPSYEYNPGLGCCIPDFGNNSWGISGLIYSIIYIFIGLLLPAILVTICNLRILSIARYHRHRIASAIYEVTLSAQVTITHQRNPFFIPTITAPSSGGPPKFHSAASTVMQLVGSLYLLYLPYCVLILWELVCNGKHFHVHPKILSLASLLLASSPPINGLLYGLKSRTLRRSVQNYWRKKITKSELQQEIQARTPSVAGSRRPSASGPVSLFPFPPLQRRLSEALLNLGTKSQNSGFDNNNVIGFNKTKLQSAASCNTLRVPTTESNESNTRVVRTSTSAASLMGHFKNDREQVDINLSVFDTSKKSPRILITRTESLDCDSPIIKRTSITKNKNSIINEKRGLRQMSAGSDSSTGSSETNVWTTKILPKTSGTNLNNSMDNWPTGKRFTRVRTLEDMMLASNRASNNSESSDTTDTTTATTIASSTSTTTTILPTKSITMANEQSTCDDENLNDKFHISNDDGDDNEESQTNWSSSDDNDKYINDDINNDNYIKKIKNDKTGHTKKYNNYN